MEIVDAKYFINMEFQPRKNLLAPWLQKQGLTLIHGARGLGKTYMSLSVAVAIAGGGEFLSWQAPDPCGVLYVDGEMPASLMQQRLKAILCGQRVELKAPLKILTPDLQLATVPSLSTIEGQAAIESHLSDISLIIFDNISTLFGNNENLTACWKPIQKWSLSLRRRGYSILFIHHSGKNGLQRGASSREDALDLVIHLRRPDNYDPAEGARFEIHYQKARGLYGHDVRPFEAKLVSDANGLTWMREEIVKDDSQEEAEG
jgi:putative DNA primase/helicase